MESFSEKYPSIQVTVRPQYVEEQSDPEENRFVYAYTVTIQNLGDQPATLLRRHWVITNGDGEAQMVEGEGVIGEQPRILPGDSYTYTSGTVIETLVGSMQGSYLMVTEEGDQFNAEIPVFTLAQPNSLH